jgi:hypothetical protein
VKLERCKDQGPETLDAFYEKIAHLGAAFGCDGKTMLSLLSALRALPDDREVWGLTSNYRLCLLAEDTPRCLWYVILYALDSRNIWIEYLMPTDGQPWANAYVRGEAHSLEDAVKMILIATARCEGWALH